MFQDPADAGSTVWRIVVLGEPDIALGDGRLEWADGGIAIESAVLDEAVDRAVRGVFGPVAG